MKTKLLAAAAVLVSTAASAQNSGPIIHDAEFFVLNAQHGDRWATEDAEIQQRLE